MCYPHLQMRSLRFMGKISGVYFYRDAAGIKTKTFDSKSSVLLTYHKLSLCPLFASVSLRSRFLHSPPPTFSPITKLDLCGTNWDFAYKVKMVESEIHRLETEGLSFCPICSLLSPSRPPLDIAQNNQRENLKFLSWNLFYWDFSVSVHLLQVSQVVLSR